MRLLMDAIFATAFPAIMFFILDDIMIRYVFAWLTGVGTAFLVHQLIKISVWGIDGEPYDKESKP